MRARRLAPAMLALAIPAAATAADEPAAPPDPALTNVRYDEDWSVLADAPRAGTDRFKYIPLDPSGGAYLTTGIELRARLEAFDDNLWGSAAAPDDAYLWLRALPYADLHVGRARAFVQPIASAAIGVSPSASPVDTTGIDLLQGFADVELPVARDATLTLRGGRALMPLGSERLVGTRYGPNVPLAFDGARAILRAGALETSLFYTWPVLAGRGDFDDRSSDQKRLWGVYATLALARERSIAIDVYYLDYRNRTAIFDQGAGRETRQTAGTRFFGRSGDWRWNVEAMVQRGRFAGADIRAWSVATEVSRAFPALPLSPEMTLRFNIVSGDKDPDDPRLQTFNALFPKGKYFGELSPIGPHNIVNLHSAFAFDLGGGITLGLAAILYWRQSRGDGLYDIPGNLIRGDGGSTARFVGRQVEATLEWQATPAIDLSLSASAFDAGAFLRDTGPARTIAMVGAEASYRF